MGIVGLKPAEFWDLTWADYDDLLFNVRYREQQALVGPRMVATQLYNLAQGFSTNPRAMKETAYRPLPLIDPAPESAKPIDPDWWARMQQHAAKSGLRFLD